MAASFSSVGRFNRVGPLFFRFVPFHISLLLFSLPLSSSKLNPNFPGPSFSPPSLSLFLSNIHLYSPSLVKFGPFHRLTLSIFILAADFLGQVCHASKIL